MLLRTTVPVWRISRHIALLALLLPAACSGTPAPNASDSPFYLAPARDTAASTPSGRSMEQPHGMGRSGSASSMQNGIGPDASPTGLPSGSGSASFGTGSPGSSGGE